MGHHNDNRRKLPLEAASIPGKAREAVETLAEGLRVRNYSPVETATPEQLATVVVEATATQPAPTRAALLTPTPLPPNPALVTHQNLQASFVQGMSHHSGCVRRNWFIPGVETFISTQMMMFLRCTLGFFGFRKKPVPDQAVRTVLIVGLGNPGREYRGNRHNIGFMFIDQLCETMNVRLSRVQSKALIGSGLMGDSKIVLAKPQTFMNNSGQAIAALVRFYKIPLDQLLVVHDDLDLPLGNAANAPGRRCGRPKRPGVDHPVTGDTGVPTPAPRYRAPTGPHGTFGVCPSEFFAGRAANCQDRIETGG
jgi:hypothetical protein